ncbi:MAG: RND family transporter, partial [Phycisphaerae bacterium]
MALAAIILVGVAPGAVRLRLRTDGHALVPESAPPIRVDDEIRETFGIEDPVVVLIRSTDERGVFNEHTLRLVKELTGRLQETEGLKPQNVISLALERGDRVKPGTLTFRRFLEPMPTSCEELDQLRDDLEAIELYTGVLVSYDATATAILVGVPKGSDRTELYRRIRGVVGTMGDVPERIDVIGAPVAEALLGTHILADLGVPSAVLGVDLDADDPDGASRGAWHVPRTLYELRLLIGRHIGLVPVALLIMAVVFYAAFRSVAAVFLPLAEVGACLLFVFGLMGWLDVPVYLTIAVLPVMLTAIGVADEIHVFDRYQGYLRAGMGDGPPSIPPRGGEALSPPLGGMQGGHVGLITRTMDEMWRPVAKTSVTTAVGFLSFALSPIGAVRAFGIFTAVGIVFCMAWSLAVTPAMLALARPGWMIGRRGRRLTASPAAAVTGGGRLFGGVSRLAVRGRYVVIVLTIGLLALCPRGLGRVRVQDSWVDGFAAESAFSQATRFFNEQFLGIHTLLVCVDGGDARRFTGSIEREAVDHGTIRIPAAGIADPEKLVGYALYLRRKGLPGSGAVPPDPRVRYTWDTRVAAAAREGEMIVLTTLRRDGSPRLAMRLMKEDVADYELRPEWFMRPEVVRQIGELDAFIEDHREEEVGGVLSPADYVATTEFMIRARASGSRRVPDLPDRLEWVWNQYRRVRGEARWSQAVTPDYTRSLVSVYLKNANFVDTRRLMEDLGRYEREQLAPAGMSLSFGGDVAVSQTLIEAIVTTQLRSLVGSLVGILIVTALLGGSLVWGVLCVLPCGLAVLINFVVMGYVGMPLGVATSMFSGMTLGIGVDYAIHLTERYRRGRRSGLGVDEGLHDALSATGPAVLIDA